MKNKNLLFPVMLIATVVYSCSSSQPAVTSGNTTGTSNKSYGQIALQESTVPIRPGVPGKTPFWNVAAKRFIYAPAFDFKAVPNAARYRFEVVSELDNSKHEFESEVPYAPLSPVWAAVP